MQRRHVFAVLGLLALGCSQESAKKKGGLGGSYTRSKGRSRLDKGPQTMGDMLLKSYIADLKSTSKQKQLTAARELGNMGPTASGAVPALEKLAGGGDAEVRAAAKAAVTAIKRR
jgi:hypothetical protein